MIVDEVFADYELESGAARAAGQPLHQTGCLAFSLGGLSKSIGLPQAKLGWIAASGPERLVAEALSRLEFLGDTYLSVSTPVQAAAAELLESGAPVRTSDPVQGGGQLSNAADARGGGSRLPGAGRRRRLVRRRAGAFVHDQKRISSSIS